MKEVCFRPADGLHRLPFFRFGCLFYLNDLYHLPQFPQRDTLRHFRLTVTHVTGDFFRFNFIQRNVRFFRILCFKLHLKLGFNRLRGIGVFFICQLVIKRLRYRFLALRDKYRSIINPF